MSHGKCFVAAYQAQYPYSRLGNSGAPKTLKFTSFQGNLESSFARTFLRINSADFVSFRLPAQFIHIHTIVIANGAAPCPDIDGGRTSMQLQVRICVGSGCCYSTTLSTLQKLSMCTYGYTQIHFFAIFSCRENIHCTSLSSMSGMLMLEVMIIHFAQDVQIHKIVIALKCTCNMDISSQIVHSRTASIMIRIFFCLEFAASKYCTLLMHLDIVTIIEDRALAFAVVPKNMVTLMMNLIVGSLGLLALSTTSVHAQGGKRGGGRPIRTVTTIMDNSQTVSASLYEPLTTTYTADCFNGPDYSVATPCQQSCGFTSYIMRANQYNTEAREVTLEMSYVDFCTKVNGGSSLSLYVCAKLSTPPATWTRVGNTVTVKAEATLADCGYYSEDAMTPPPNPLVGKKMTVDVVITCKKLSQDTNKCRNVNTGPDGYSRSRNFSYFENCSATNVGKLTVDGVQKTFSNAYFGVTRYKDRTVSKAPAPQAAPPQASG
jgi:hypothetical protein